MSAVPCVPDAAARATALLRPAKEKCGSADAEQRARQRHGAGIADPLPTRSTAGPPG